MSDAAIGFARRAELWSPSAAHTVLYDVKLQTLGVTAGYDAFAIVEGDPRDWQFVAGYGRDGRTVAVLSTIPWRVDDYRDALRKWMEFPPKSPD